jgi:hypothetical protein
MSNQPYSPDPRMPNYPPPSNSPVEPPAHDTVREVNAGGAYAQSRHENYVDPAGNQVETHAEVVEDENQRRTNARYWVTTVTYFLLGVLEVILALRFLFRLLGASQGSGFVLFLYNLSYPFVVPFNGIFNDQNPVGTSVFEFSTIVAMLIYALIAWGIVSLGRVLFSPNLTGEQHVTTTRHRRYT